MREASGVMRVPTTSAENVLEMGGEKKKNRSFFVVSLSTFSAVCRQFCAHSAGDSFEPVEISNRACAALAVRNRIHSLTFTLAVLPLTFKTRFRLRGEEKPDEDTAR